MQQRTLLVMFAVNVRNHAYHVTPRLVKSQVYPLGGIDKPSHFWEGLPLIISNRAVWRLWASLRTLYSQYTLNRHSHPIRLSTYSIPLPGLSITELFPFAGLTSRLGLSLLAKALYGVWDKIGCRLRPGVPSLVQTIYSLLPKQSTDVPDVLSQGYSPSREV
jgi:hypothetical protein